MQSEQCYRQWRKVRKGGGGQAGPAGAWVAVGCGVRVVGGRWGACAGGVSRGWGGAGGRGAGRSRGKRSRPVGSGMQSEQCYRQWRKERRGGGAGGSGAGGGAFAGRGVRRAVVTAGGEGWGVHLARGGVSGAACQGCGVRVLDRLRSRAWLQGSGGVWRWWVSPATGVLLRGSDEDVDCTGTEAGEPGAGAWGETDKRTGKQTNRQIDTERHTDNPTDTLRDGQTGRQMHT